MTAAAAVAGASLMLGILVGAPGHRVFVRRSRSQSVSADVSLLRRLRLPLALLAGAAGWAFVGGAIGAGVGGVIAALAWRTLGSTISPGQQRERQRLESDYPLVAELLAHALAAGTDIGTALELVAEAVGDPWNSRLAVCVHALGLGQTPAEVWAGLEGDALAHGLGRALGRSQATGVPVADAMRRLAQNLREEADLAAQAYARTIEVRAAAPLGMCFLPAFVLLGVVPLVVGVLTGVSWVGTS